MTPSTRIDDGPYTALGMYVRLRAFRWVAERKCHYLDEVQCIFWDDKTIWETLLSMDLEDVHTLNCLSRRDAVDILTG